MDGRNVRFRFILRVVSFLVSSVSSVSSSSLVFQRVTFQDNNAWRMRRSHSVVVTVQSKCPKYKTCDTRSVSWSSSGSCRWSCERCGGAVVSIVVAIRCRCDSRRRGGDKYGAMSLPVVVMVVQHPPEWCETHGWNPSTPTSIWVVVVVVEINQWNITITIIIIVVVVVIDNMIRIKRRLHCRHNPLVTFRSVISVSL